MGQINLNDLQKRKLEKCYLAWYIITKPITIRNSVCIETKQQSIIPILNLDSHFFSGHEQKKV